LRAHPLKSSKPRRENIVLCLERNHGVNEACSNASK
jgi:hypothetical protein